MQVEIPNILYPKQTPRTALNKKPIPNSEILIGIILKPNNNGKGIRIKETTNLIFLSTLLIFFENKSLNIFVNFIF